MFFFCEHTVLFSSLRSITCNIQFEKQALIGPYWSLRAVLGPVLETYILLDRLLYLQEQFHPEATAGSNSQGLPEPRLVALFNPDTSPRNMAIMAIKT